jgi:hypothetical protein
VTLSLADSSVALIAEAAPLSVLAVLAITVDRVSVSANLVNYNLSLREGD